MWELIARNDQWRIAITAVGTVEAQLNVLVANVQKVVPGTWVPQELLEARDEAKKIRALQTHPADSDRLQVFLSKQQPRILRWAIEDHITRLQSDLEKARKVAHVAAAHAPLEKEIFLTTSLLNCEPIRSAEAAGPFYPTLWLNLEAAQEILGDDAELMPRKYDSKFHTLMDSNLFLSDLKYYLNQCRMRGRPLAVAYVDIDNFKNFNSELPSGETQVDRDVLPRFMSGLESFVFGRGFAYREGGDEYLVLLPNASHGQAVQIFNDLRSHLSSLEYPEGITSGPTVSIGLCVVGARDRLSPLQIQELANRAKKHAKDGGRDRVSSYRDASGFRQDDLRQYTESSQPPNE